MLYDCIVIGGGPAGSFCAKKLVEQGQEVLLLEKGHRYRYKVCGGGINLRSIDLLGAVPEQAFEQFGKIELHSIHSIYRHPDENVYDGRKGLMMYRTVFDQWLRDSVEKKGVEVRHSAEVEDIKVSSSDISAILSDGNVQRANCIVVAAGVNVSFLQKIGLEVPPTILAIQKEYALDEERVNERFGDWAVLSFNSSAYSSHGYAWVFPKKRGVSIGVVDKMRSGSDLQLRLDNYLMKDPYVAPKLKGAKKVKIRGVHFSAHMIPIRISKTTYRDRMLVIGDAGGFADPFSFEGISYALSSGDLASQTLLHAKEKNDYSKDTLSIFMKKWKTQIYESWNKYSEKLVKAIYDNPDMDVILDRMLMLANRNYEIGMGLTDMTSGMVDHKIAYSKIMSQQLSLIRALGILRSIRLLSRIM